MSDFLEQYTARDQEARKLVRAMMREIGAIVVITESAGCKASKSRALLQRGLDFLGERGMTPDEFIMATVIRNEKGEVEE